MRSSRCSAQAAAGRRHSHQRGTIDEIYDKGAAKGAIMYMTRKLYEAAIGDLLVTMGNGVVPAGRRWLRRQERRRSQNRVRCPTDRPPDPEVCRSHAESGADLPSRGDYNPLHIDPEVAAQRRLRSAHPAWAVRLRHGSAHPDQGALRRRSVELRRLDALPSPVSPGEPLQVDIWHMALATRRSVFERPRDVVVQDFGRFRVPARSASPCFLPAASSRHLPTSARPFVASMKGRILTHLAAPRIIDVTHEVPVYWPAEAGLLALARPSVFRLAPSASP